MDSGAHPQPNSPSKCKLRTETEHVIAYQVVTTVSPLELSPFATWVSTRTLLLQLARQEVVVRRPICSCTARLGSR